MELFPQIMGGLILLAFGLIALGWILDFLSNLGSGGKSAEESMKDVHSAVDDMIEHGKNAEYRDLNLDALGLIGLKDFGEIIESVKTDFDPLVRLTLCYMFIEQLSPNFSKEDDSSIADFSYHFFKDQLSEDDWNTNFRGSELGSGYFEQPAFWAGLLLGRIQSSYEHCSTDDEKGNICTQFCTEICSDVSDDDLITKFIEIAKRVLEEKNLMTNFANSAFISMEL